MKRFVELVQALDSTTKTRRKRDALVRYFREAPAGDAAHAVAVLCGQRPRRGISTTRLREIVAELAGLPEWLVAESHHQVGDLAETLALLLPPPRTQQEWPLHEWMTELLPAVRKADERSQIHMLRTLWDASDMPTRFVMHKLLLGGFRVGVARQSVVLALAEALDQPAEQIAARLMGKIPTDAGLLDRLRSDSRPEDSQMPYPFLLAHPLPLAETENAADEPSSSIHAADHAIEPKWDGIRLQIVRRAAVSLWSRGEEEISAAFPELADVCALLPEGTTLDGELVAGLDNDSDGWPRVASFASLQQRLNRKRPGTALIRRIPVRFLAFDVLQFRNEDFRDRPWHLRRAALQALFDDLPTAAAARVQLSPVHEPKNFEAVAHWRQEAIARGAEGIMLKAKAERYAVGRPRGVWWKWKREPRTFDGVLLYAQAGHGRRAGLHTDLTFGVWADDELVPVAKAYSGLSDAEFRKLDKWVRQNTTERFGPVRQVPAEQVFEVAFEGVNPSKRHKAGLALRFPRIVRWRTDIGPADADHLPSLQEHLSDEDVSRQVVRG